MNKTNKKAKCSFVACRKNSDGTLKEFKDNHGKVYDYEQALEAVESGCVENAIPFTGKDGKRHIRGTNDHSKNNNLKKLEEF